MKQKDLIKRIVATAATLILAGPAYAPLALADSAPLGLDSPRLVLKGGPHFLVLDPDGMIAAGPGSPYGLFEDDTRFLSQWEVLLNDKHIHPLTAFTREGYTGSFLYGNPASDQLPAQSILLKRELVLQDGFCERLTVQSYVDQPLKFKLSLLFGADFLDMFEVRGQKRLKHGVSVYAQSGGKYTTTYTGVDNSVVTSTVTYPDNVATFEKPGERKLNFEINLAPRGKQTIELNVGNTLATASLTKAAGDPDKVESFDKKKADAEAELAHWQDAVATITTDNEPLNKMIDQAARDIFLLRQNTPKGPCLAAGLPWYAVAFGRDQSVTGLQMLTFAPSLSKQILQVLANYQGTKVDKFTEEQPGRILHELRLGEMARSREIPFIPFYGSIDSTPLWLLLLNRYVDTTGDIALAKELWPNVVAALGFLDKQTDGKFGGFLSYGGQGKSFLSNQCWKDSSDSIMNKDGSLAKQPIAACEVQGYLYKCYVDTAKLAKQLGHDDVALALSQKAAALKENFQKYFWMEDAHFVALALDGDNKQCAVISSNPGQLLFTGILDGAQADKVVDRMMQKDMFSGWGLRTLATSEVKYNPMSYHDGTVWPHDNAITVDGMAETNHPEAAQTVMSSLIDTATTASDYRLPELFCGFNRGDFDTPVPYPVSCVPQAWAAGSIFEMLKATLGINLTADKITVTHPTLPKGVNKLTVQNLHCAGKRVKLTFIRKKEGAPELDVHVEPGAPVTVNL
jgi:glycogen debranching enzyme